MKIVIYDQSFTSKIWRFVNTIYNEYNDALCLNDYDKDLLDIKTNYQEKGGQFWIGIDDENNIIATCACRFYISNNKWMELKRFFVLKNYRGRGIAHKLYNKIIEWSDKKEIENLIFWSDIRYKRAHNFFSKKGFEIIDKRNKYDSLIPYTEYCFMRKY